MFFVLHCEGHVVDLELIAVQTSEQVTKGGIEVRDIIVGQLHI